MPNKDDIADKYHMPWYAASSNRLVATLGSLKKEVNCDICIIGGGFTGLSAALELSKKNYNVILLEKDALASSASGRNGGQLQRGYPQSPGDLAEKYGKADAKVMCDITMEGIQLIHHRIKKYNIKCDFKPGVITTGLDAGHMRGLEEEIKEWKAIGYDDLELLDKEQTREIIKSDAYVGALFDKAGGHFHPFNYGLGIARAAQKAGCKFFDHTRAKKIVHGKSPKVITDEGVVNAKYVILGGAIRLKGSEPLMRRSITATAHIIATEPLGERRMNNVMTKDVAVSDCRFIMDYYRFSGDTRLLFGGNCNYSDMGYPGEDKRLRERMVKIFPQLSMVRIDHCWHGPLEFTINRLPGLGRLTPNVYYAHGFGGQGVIATNILGCVLAEAVSGHAERFDVFAKIKHTNFPGGNLLKRPMFVLGMTWYKLRDLL